MQTPEQPAAAALAARHTPGPWHWSGRHLVPTNPDPARHAVHTILDRGDGGFGFTGKDNATVLAELQADDALIAAAPDLLAALRTLTSRYRAVMFGTQGGGRWDDALVHAERAIASAEGRA